MICSSENRDFRIVHLLFAVTDSDFVWTEVEAQVTSHRQRMASPWNLLLFAFIGSRRSNIFQALAFDGGPILWIVLGIRQGFSSL